MRYTVEITPAAKRQLADMPRAMRIRLDEHILALETAPRPRGAIKLAGVDDLWRIRVGNYRVIYQVLDRILRVIILRVAHRREAYR